jgi:hypothetical protein
LSELSEVSLKISVILESRNLLTVPFFINCLLKLPNLKIAFSLGFRPFKNHFHSIRAGTNYSKDGLGLFVKKAKAAK